MEKERQRVQRSSATVSGKKPAWKELIRCESFNLVFVTDSVPQRMLLTDTQNKLLG